MTTVHSTGNTFPAVIFKRILLSVGSGLDPDSIRSTDPDPGGLNSSLVAWMYFMEV